MNLQVISGPRGETVWVSGPLPGSVHDLTAARTWGMLRELAAAGLVVLADKGYHGAGEPLITPYKGRNLPAAYASANGADAPAPRPPASAPTPTSSPSASCGNSAAVPSAPGSSPRPSTSSVTARSGSENRSVMFETFPKLIDGRCRPADTGRSN